LLEEPGDRDRVSDRVARDDEHPALDAVPEERGSLRVEEVVLVRPQLEERQRVGAVLGDEESRGVAKFVIGEVPRGRKRAEEEPRGGEDGQDRDQLDRQAGPSKLVAEAERPRLPEQEIAGLAKCRSCTDRGWCRDRDDRERGDERGRDEQRNEQERR